MITARPLKWFLPQWPLGGSSFIPKNVSIFPSWELYTHDRKCAHMLEVKNWFSGKHILWAAETLETCIWTTFTICVIFSKYYSGGHLKSLFLNHTEISSRICEELSSLMKVWGKALLFSVSGESCFPKSLSSACDYLEKAVTVIRYLDRWAGVVGGSRRGTGLRRSPLLGRIFKSFVELEQR